MNNFKKETAYEEQVLEKALEILKEKGIETDLAQLTRVYELSAKFIKKSMREEEYCSVNLQPLGKAYYHIYDINKIKLQKASQIKHSEIYSEEHEERLKKEVETWQKKYDDSIEVFETKRPSNNVSSKYMLYPIIQNLRRAIKRRKITSKEVEDIQNNIE